MKKWVAILLAMAMLWPLTAVASSTPQQEANFTAALQDKLPEPFIANVGIVARVQIQGMDNITDFGTYIYYSMEAAKEHCPNTSKVDVRLIDKDNPANYIIFESGVLNYGTIRDYRSGVERVVEIETLDDLIAEFPAMRSVGIGSSVSAEDIATYNEIMAILNSDYSRSEEEILAEIAPDYGMTVEEMQQFLQDTMIALYS